MGVRPSNFPSYVLPFSHTIHTASTLSVPHIRCHGLNFLPLIYLLAYTVYAVGYLSGSGRIIEVITIGCQWSSAQPTNNSCFILWSFERSVIVYDLPFFFLRCNQTVSMPAYRSLQAGP